MKKIPLTKGYEAIVDDQDFERLREYNWQASFRKGRVYARTCGLEGHRTIQMHRLITNAAPNTDVDHIDGNGLNNTRTNLRLGPRKNNAMNRRKLKVKSSVYKGVSWFKQHQKWRADIRINKKLYFLGLFSSEIEAAEAYDEAARERFGEWACLNFPKSQEPTAIGHDILKNREKQKLLKVCKYQRRNRTSSFRGVIGKKYGRWQVQLVSKGSKFNLGTYDTEREAALVYDWAAMKLGLSNQGANFPLIDPESECNWLKDKGIADLTRPKRIKTSRHKGIHLNRKTGKWIATYGRTKTKKFDSEEEAFQFLYNAGKVLTTT